MRRTRLAPFLLFACLSSGAFAGPSASAQGGPVAGRAVQDDVVAPQRWSVLVILLDDIGLEKLYAYDAPGNQEAFLPVLERLASTGILFKNAYSNPICGATRAALMTGRHCFRTGFGSNPRNPGGYPLPDDEIGLGELAHLAPGGYGAGVFGKWHLGLRSDPQHAVRATGFDVFIGQIGNVGPNATPDLHHFNWFEVAADQASVSARFVSGPPFDVETWATSVGREDLQEWILAQNGPFVAYWAPPSPHEPFQVPPHDLLSEQTLMGAQRGYSQPIGPSDGSVEEQDPEIMRQYYDAMAEATDREIGLLLAGIADRLDDTLVIVMGDNGTSQQVILPPYDPEHAKGSIYEQGVHVPMIVNGPLVDNPGRVVDGLVHVVDVWPTVAELIGVGANRLGAARTIDGISFLPTVVDGDVPIERESVYCEVFKPSGVDLPREFVRRCIIDGRYKYVFLLDNADSGQPEITEQFFDLLLDPFELVDLAAGQLWTVEEEYVFYTLRVEMNTLLDS